MMFIFELGDFSSDGHGITGTFFCNVDTQNMNEVKEAWNTAKKTVPKEYSPLSYCNDDGDNYIPKKALDPMLAYYKLACEEQMGDEDDQVWIEDTFMAEIVIAFLNKGNPNLNARLINLPCLPMGNIGYGLYSN